MIVKSALLTFRTVHGQKELLFVRVHNKPYYVLPGGKQERGETLGQALDRELHEELRVTVTGAEEIGVVEGTTPDGRILQEHLYAGNLAGNPAPFAEIKEIAWMTREEALRQSKHMTPMTLHHIFPFLAAHKLW
jgi:ADP-ribose pyrophosphatase YjhB (NUDIX family)